MANIELSGAPQIKQLEFISLLGVGGMSRVYKARQTLLDRFVAVKVLSRQALLTETALKRFSVEAKLTSSLSHPNIVQVMNHGISADGQAYLVMELVEGNPLSEVISKDAPISYRRFQNIFIPLLSALEHAHGKGIIHRDIKPSNIIISHDVNGKELAKLVDFGIAKALVDPAGASPTPELTKTGFAIGSPTYMSPEQCLGSELDCRSDLYSLACVMYESLSGEPPYVADSSLDVMYKHMHQARIMTKELSARMEIPETLIKAILWPLNKEPSKRPESASQLAAKLSAALDAITLDRAPHKVLKRIDTGTKRYLYVGCAVAIIALSVFAVFSVFKNRLKEASAFAPQRLQKPTFTELSKQVSMLLSKGKEREAIEYCQKSIEAAKHGTRVELAQTYDAVYIGLYSSDSGRSRQVSDHALAYAKQSLSLFEYLKNENGICDMSSQIASTYASDNKDKEALKTLDNAMLRIPNSTGNRSWYVCNKLHCLLSLRQYREAMQLGKKYIEGSDTTNRNANFYHAWVNYSLAIANCKALEDEIDEQAKLAKALLKEHNLSVAQRVGVYRSLDVLVTGRPAFAIGIFKDELQQSKDAFTAVDAEQECWLRIFLGRSYLSKGQRDLAQIEFLKVLNKSAKLQYVGTIELRRQCLTSLVKISKDEPSTQADYLEELKKLNQPEK